MKINEILTDHTLIINELEKNIKLNNWNCILSFLPEGSFLVGGYIRDIILGRISKNIDVDIVVPANAKDIGLKIANKLKAKFVILDKERELVRIILNNVSIDIANQVSQTIDGDLKSRDFSINAIGFLFNQKILVDPLNGIKDIKFSILRTYAEINLLNDPIRILRCFRFVSELNFKIDLKLIPFIKKNKEKLKLVAKERINYEIKRIIQGSNALECILLIKQLNIFGPKNLVQESFSIDLKKINYEQLNESEKKQFLPLFFLVQILNEESLDEFKFSKTEILNINLLRKWNKILSKKNIFELNEVERFDLHKELEFILPSFIFYLPQNLHLDWLNRWRDRDDKLFHPANLINGEEIKKHLNMKEGPLLGRLLGYLSKELAYKRLNNFDEAIYKAKHWIEQNAPKCD